MKRRHLLAPLQSALARLGRRGPSSDRDEEPLSAIEQASLNIKFFGYEMARRIAADLPEREGLAPARVGLACKPSTQDDMESDWCAYWARELRVSLVMHRKLWELCYVLQALWERGCLEPGKRGVVFGCGRESLPSYLAAKGVFTLATDLPRNAAAAKGWAATAQHAGEDELFHPHLCSRMEFDRHVERRDVDMNAIPADIQDFDFCWSICSFEHLGSIENGLAFVEKAMKTVKPRGVAVHTTEFNFLNADRTLDRGPTVLFLRRHFEELRQRLLNANQFVTPMDFDVGHKPMDKFIDLPPYPIGGRAHLFEHWRDSYHLKAMCDGFPTTCYGLIVRRGE